MTTHNNSNMDRIYDPFNYEQACYYIALENMSYEMREHYDEMDAMDIILWLGTDCGKSFLDEVKKLIDEYPFKSDSSFAIICGKINIPEVVYGHREWIKEKLKK